jgi:exopolyphosphatase/guanosine-5'-triphosphate,3'-diphosphate pyrophosphatase
MAEAQARAAGEPSRTRGAEPQRSYAALDLGTNNCRLLIAQPAGGGFRVVEAFSRIVRLGEGLGSTGALQEAAMDRALGALHICAEKVRRRRVTSFKAVATQACRAAANGAEFIARVTRETGLKLRSSAPRRRRGSRSPACRT